MGLEPAYLFIVMAFLYMTSLILRHEGMESSMSDELPIQAKRMGGQLSNTRNAQEAVRLIYGRTRVGVNIVYMNSSGDTLNQLDIIGILGEGEIEGIAKGILSTDVVIDGSTNVLCMSYDSGSPSVLTVPTGTYSEGGAFDLHYLCSQMKAVIDNAFGCISTVRWNANCTFTFEVSSPHTLSYYHSLSTIGEKLGLSQDHTGQFVTSDNAIDNGEEMLFLDGKLYTDFGASVSSYTIYKGTPYQNAATVSGEWNDPMRHTAYIHLTLLWDTDAVNQWQGLPNITVELEGLKCYNPVSEKFEYTDNPALAAYDFMTRSSRRGGMGIDSARIDIDSVISAANYCDYKGWTIGYPTIENKEAVEILRDILMTFRGELIYSDNLFKLRYRDLNYESSVISITEDDIVESGGKSSIMVTQPSVYNTPNAIRMKFLNSGNKYIEDDYVLADPDLILSDGGDYRENTVSSLGIHTYVNAMRMANYWLERMRVNKTVSFVGHSRCLQLEPFDIITLTHSRFGWTDKYLRVEQVEYSQDGTASIQLSEEETAFYDDVYNLSDHDWHDTTLPNPATDEVPSVINVSIYEETYYYRERTFTRLKVDFDVPTPATYPWWDYAEIWLKIGYEGTWKFMTKSRSDYQLDPVEEGVTYYFKMVSVSIFGTKEDFDTASSASKTVIGYTGIPSNLSGVTGVASGDTITIFADPISDPDIEGYEIRIGPSWHGGLLFAFTKAPYIRLTGMKTGDFTFWIAAKNNAGRYSATPKSCTVSVLGPANYSAVAGPWSWDFTTGVHQNTQKTSYGGNDCLGCEHAYVTGANLLPNGDFDADIASWSASGTESSVFDASGLVGGCMKVVAGGSYTGRYQNITVVAGTSYRLRFNYKNTASDVAAYKIRDVSNSADIVVNTDLADSTSWSALQTVDFTAPAGCTSVGIYMLAKTDTDIVWFDSITVYEKNTTANLTGIWLSPEYDLTSKMKARIYGDFVTVFSSLSLTWGSLFPSGTKWSDRITEGMRWQDLLSVDNAGSIQARLYWGDSPGSLTNYADFFQVLAVEINARYVQVEVTLTDPNDSDNLYLRELNMYAEYWA